MKYIKLFENFNTHEILGYHISQYDFDEFNNDANIGNFGTILGGSYFLDDKKEIFNFGTDGFLYEVKIISKTPFYFDLRTNEHWYLSTEFQELLNESLVGYETYLDVFLEEQGINDVNDIDCIILTNLDYLNNKETQEIIVLDDSIITILEKTIVK